MCVEVDKKASEVRQRRIEQESRECRIQKRQQNEKRRKLERDNEQVLAPGYLSDAYIRGSASSRSGDDDSEIELSEYRNLTPIPTVASEADSYGITNRAEAAISTAALIDYGIITSDYNMIITDHHNVWRTRQSWRRNLKASLLITCILLLCL